MKTVLIILSLFTLLAGIAYMMTIYFIGRGMTWGQLDKPELSWTGEIRMSNRKLEGVIHEPEPEVKDDPLGR